MIKPYLPEKITLFLIIKGMGHQKQPE